MRYVKFNIFHDGDLKGNELRSATSQRFQEIFNKYDGLNCNLNVIVGVYKIDSLSFSLNPDTCTYFCVYVTPSTCVPLHPDSSVSKYLSRRVSVLLYLHILE